MRSVPRPVVFTLLLLVPLLGGADGCGDEIVVGMDPTEEEGSSANPAEGGNGGLGNGDDAQAGGGDSDGSGSEAGTDGDANGEQPDEGNGGEGTDGNGEENGGGNGDANNGDGNGGEDDVACGPSVCTGGMVCCNASCGTCTPPGGFCTQQACSPDVTCERQDCGELPERCADGSAPPASCDANDEGVCEWTVRECPPPGPCDADECPAPAPGAPNVLCEDGSTGGPVCERNDAGECGWNFRECPPEEIVCGGFIGAQCPSREYYCDYASGQGCGIADGQGVCKVRPDECLAVYDPVCTCDFRTVSSACDAASMGLSVLHEGACTIDECEDRGGQVIFSNGASIPPCPQDKEDLGELSGSFEGARCCI